MQRTNSSILSKLATHGLNGLLSMLISPVKVCMPADNRKFCGSISVRIDTHRVKLELSPAPLHGGPEGMYRVRADRRWLDTEDGQPRFLDRDGLARLAADMALDALEAPAPAPEIPCPSRVSVRTWKEDMPYYEGTWTNTPPIRAYDGRWMVNVSLGGKRVFVPVEDVAVHGGRRERR